MASEDPRETWARMTRGMGLRERSLNAAEERIVRHVFQDTVPVSRVAITDGMGLGGSVFTQPQSGLLNLVTLGGYQSFWVHAGPEGFARGLQGPDRAGTLVHELTHVWQGWNGDGFFLSAGLCQLGGMVLHGDRNAAYVYKAGEPWERYTVEQQAQIVEDWYTTGAVESDKVPLYQYIRVLRDPVGRRLQLFPFAPYHD